MGYISLPLEKVCEKADAAYFETQFAHLQAHTGCKAPYDHAEISVSVKDHDILPALNVFADIDVDLYVRLTHLS
jgi:hypothetical protein